MKLRNFDPYEDDENSELFRPRKQVKIKKMKNSTKNAKGTRKPTEND